MKTFVLKTFALCETTVKANSQIEALHKFNTYTDEQKLRRTKFYGVEYEGDWKEIEEVVDGIEEKYLYR